MKIINGGSDLQISVKFYDSNGVIIPLAAISYALIQFFTDDVAHSISYHKSDIDEMTGILRVSGSDLMTLTNGCLYYKYSIAFADSEWMDDGSYDVVNVYQTDLYLKNTPECKRPTTATAISELYNDTDFVSKLWVMKHVVTSDEEYVTEDTLEEFTDELTRQINLRPTKDEVYTKIQADRLFATKQDLIDASSQGLMGTQGYMGTQGEQGAQGYEGPQGPEGPQGAIGTQGYEGPQGAIGTQGEVGAQGAEGPQGPLGIQGEIGPQGPVGTQGVAGPDGNPGAQGAIGTQGYEGPQGPLGIQGEIGPQGPIGTQGEVGAQGAEGPQGPVGTQGVIGTQGYEGPQGPQGYEGPQGNPGPDGNPGMDGNPGPDGNPGMDGNPGPDGNPGTQGVIGTQGYEGPQGPVGTQGERGAQGYPGPEADLSGYQLKSNLVTTIDASSGDDQYPSAKCMYTLIGDINERLNNI